MKNPLKKRERGKWEKVRTLIPHIKIMRMNGATEKEIVLALGISYATYARYKRTYPEFKEAVDFDITAADSMVQNALFKSAVGYTERVKKVFKLKDIHYDERGKKVEVERLEECEEEQVVPPNLSAQTYWLKNRCPKMWNEKQAESGDDKESEGGIVILPEIISLKESVEKPKRAGKEKEKEKEKEKPKRNQRGKKGGEDA